MVNFFEKWRIAKLNFLTCQVQFKAILRSKKGKMPSRFSLTIVPEKDIVHSRDLSRELSRKKIVSKISFARQFPVYLCNNMCLQAR